MIHDPIDGRVASTLPVWTERAAGVWVGLNVYIDRMTQMSSIDAGELRQQLADLDAVAAVRLNSNGDGSSPPVVALGAQVDGARTLAGVLEQRGLGVEHVELRGPAVHE